MSTKPLPTHYRYVVADMGDEYAPADYRLHVTELAAVRETPCGYWIQRHPGYSKGRLRWVSKTSDKRFAYPTKAEALANFIRRTKIHIRWEKYKLQKAEAGLVLAEALRERKA